MEDRQRPKPTGTNRPTQTHTPTPTPHTKGTKGGDGTTRGTPHPHTRGGTPHRAQPRVHYADHHQPTPHPRNKRRRGAGGPQPPTTPQSNTPHRATPARAPHTPPHVSVVNSGEATPGPIPNPEAKTPSANGTAPARTRKSRTPPSTHHPPHHPHKTTAGGNNNNTTTPDQETCHRLTGRLIQKQIPPQPKDHIHVPGQARQSVALPQCTFSW